MKLKTASARIKAVDEDGAGGGEFTALVSVFGNKDSYGDIVVPGAFAETLAEWKDSGNPIPVIWSHMYGDPDNHIGEVVEAKETDEGLWVRAKLDVDDNPRAARIHGLLQKRRVTQFSFSYDVVDGAMVKSDGDFAYELRRLKLYEVGPTLIGANQATELLDVKDGRDVAALMTRLTRALDGAGAKAGRVLSAKNEDELKTAYEAIGRVLAALDKTDEDDTDTADEEKSRGALAAAASLDDLAKALQG